MQVETLSVQFALVALDILVMWVGHEVRVEIPDKAHVLVLRCFEYAVQHFNLIGVLFAIVDLRTNGLDARVFSEVVEILISLGIDIGEVAIN